MVQVQVYMYKILKEEEGVKSEQWLKMAEKYSDQRPDCKPVFWIRIQSFRIQSGSRVLMAKNQKKCTAEKNQKLPP